MSKKLDDTLRELHIGVAELLLSKLRDGSITPNELNTARQLLKDNGICSTEDANPDLKKIKMEFPDFGGAAWPKNS